MFSEVAKHLSFSKAAQALHLTPPAITMQVKELEGHVGMPLFKRSGRQVALTTAGEYMLVFALRMLSTLKDAENTAARLQRLEVGTLTIGMVSTAKYFFPPLLTEFRREHGGIEVKPAVGNREQYTLGGMRIHWNKIYDRRGFEDREDPARVSSGTDQLRGQGFYSSPARSLLCLPQSCCYAPL